MTISKTLPTSTIASLTEEVLHEGGLFSFLVRGQSMTPTLREGDRVEVGSLHEETLFPGRLLVYRRGEEDGVVVHRLMKVGNLNGRVCCLISPDTAPLCPEEVSLDRVLGVIEHVFRGEKEFPLDRGWRLWWGRLLTVGFCHPWILRILFGLGRIGRGLFRS